MSGKIVDERSVSIPALDVVDRDSRHFRLVYERIVRRLYDEMANSKIYSFLKENARLTLVRLDRTIFAEDNEGLVAVDVPRSARKVAVIEAPIDRVKSVTSGRYNDYRVVSKRLNEELTRKIVVLLFRAPKDIFGKRTKPIPSHQIERLKSQLLSLPYFMEDQEAADRIKEYFEFALGTTDVANASSPEKSAAKILFRSFELPRIRELVDAFANYERQMAESYSELEVFVAQINSFLTESGKEVFFSEAEASLRFRLKGKADKEGRALEELSSGEQQIVTMLTYLAFVAGRDSIFVVDEPELSLHLAWQMKLVDALMSLRPKGGQLILATHSPEIVAGYRSAVVALAPAYSN